MINNEQLREELVARYFTGTDGQSLPEGYTVVIDQADLRRIADYILSHQKAELEFRARCSQWVPEKASKLSKESLIKRHNDDLDYILLDTPQNNG